MLWEIITIATSRVIQKIRIYMFSLDLKRDIDWRLYLKSNKNTNFIS